MNDDTLRTLDASLNRAREALRVIEDYARFFLDDAALTEKTKTLRHQLRRTADAFGSETLLAQRDIVADVGRERKVETELRRDSAEGVVQAAFARLGETLRSLSEYGKLVELQAARESETLRYRVYQLEQQVALRGNLRKRFRAVRLYVLVTAAISRRDWFEAAEAALRGGATCLQLREKSLPDVELLRRARRLRELTKRYGVLFVVNDRADIAKLSHADGVHLGQEDLSVREARRIAGGNLLVGKSTHTLEQFEAALAEEPDYVALGPIFESRTKPQDRLAGLPLLSAAAERSSLPIVAIGGITAAEGAKVLAAGASAVAVCSAVLDAEDVEAAARAFAAEELPHGSRVSLPGRQKIT